MKWTKIDQRTGEPMEKTVNSFMPHDYISGSYKIINNSFFERKLAWVLTKNGEEIGRYNTLKEAKARAEEA